MLRGRDTSRSTVALAVGTTIAGGIPVFLIGALFVQVQRDINAPDWVLGTSVAAFWAAAAVVSLLSGRVISAIGSRVATLVTLGTAVFGLLGATFFIPSWPWILVWAVVGGATNGLGHPASNQLMTLRVNRRSIATAFGIKQAAVPFAAFIAGLTVPLVALTLGWRWAFGFAALLCVALTIAFLLFGPTRVPKGTRVRRAHVPLDPPLFRYLLLIASVTTLGAAAAGAVSAYAVTAAIDRGIDDGFAGILLSAGSLLGASSRVISGRLADRFGGGFALPMASGMLAVGGVGVLLMAVGSPATFVVGVILALGIGWGWTGLTHFVVTRAAGAATPSATGLVQTGSYLGSGAGPLVFGIAYAASDAPGVWISVGVVQLVAAGIALFLARRPPHHAPTEHAPMLPR